MKKWISLLLTAACLLWFVPIVLAVSPISAEMLIAAYDEQSAAVVAPSEDVGADLKAAITLAKQQFGVVLLQPGTHVLRDKVTLPAGVRLAFAPGAVLQIETSGRLFCNGIIEAGDRTIFTGSGFVSGTPQNTAGNPMWFGAVGDGVTDDTDAIRDALDIFSRVVLPQTEKGYYVTYLPIKDNCIIGGADNEHRAKIVGGADSRRMFCIQGNNVIVENLSFDMSAASPESVCLYFDSAAQNLDGIRVRNIDTEGAYCVIADARQNFVSGQPCTVFHTQVEHLVCRNGRGTAIDVDDFMGFIFFTDLLLDHTQTYEKYGVAVDWPEIRITEAEGVNQRETRIVGDPAHDTGNAHGMEFGGGAACWLFNCEVSHIGGIAYRALPNTKPGAYWASGYYFYFENCSATDASVGLQLDSVHSLQLIRTAVKDCGRAGNAMQLTNCRYGQCHGLTVEGAKTDGVVLQRLTCFQLTDLTVTGCGGYGVSGSGCSGCSVVGATLTGNTGGTVGGQSISVVTR